MTQRWNINWRTGCVSRFESLWSIGQKFSYLNQVGFSDFVKVSAYRDGHYAPWRWATVIDPVRVARVIREPVNKLEFSYHDAFIPRIENAFIPRQHIERERYRNIEGASVEVSLRWCPACIERGFHSPAHQLPWLTYCLLHHCLLKNECPRCGATLSYVSAYTAFASRYRCKCGAPLWNHISSSKWPKALTERELEPMQAYVDWIRAIESAGRQPPLSTALQLLIDRRESEDWRKFARTWLLRARAP